MPEPAPDDDCERYADAIAVLLLQATALMEDASVVAVTPLPGDPDAARNIIATLAAAGADIAMLTAAAVVLQRRHIAADV